MATRRSPFFTRCPSSKRISVTLSVTLAAMTTLSLEWVVPSASIRSTKRSIVAVATITFWESSSARAGAERQILVARATRRGRIHAPYTKVSFGRWRESYPSHPAKIMTIVSLFFHASVSVSEFSHEGRLPPSLFRVRRLGRRSAPGNGEAEKDGRQNAEQHNGERRGARLCDPLIRSETIGAGCERLEIEGAKQQRRR